ncbi:DUF2934 domain-containing protein [Pseudomonas indica]|jgi:hypothetical protein|uniref:DUF2934 domain-containing protein n=1 Tax=Pseudomonas indica TaxID=137658 RepID=A0A1G8ZZW6_9PSED|nr:DUF2934 domain-containing protein [Pseudomonas indica]MBU3055793.1 DUF2934 domain-containing protein [Pseudomonas indica]PAU59167.1 hypothetical protein BZL42_11910 [Pseudomonas indica]SDK20551.1 Protein of unknown function [Pseudomonas indica]
MVDDSEIRQRAYALWEKQGRPEGSAERFWAQAREQLQAERQQPLGDASESFSGGIESNVAPPMPKRGSRS